MQENVINAFTEQAKTMFAPASKFNGLMVDSLEKMTEFQMKAIKSYSDILFGQMKKAAEVKDVDTLRTFSSSQAEAAGNINKKVIEDAKALTEMATDFKEQVESIMEESRSTAATATKAAPTKKAS